MDHAAPMNLNQRYRQLMIDANNPVPWGTKGRGRLKLVTALYRELIQEFKQPTRRLAK